MTRVVLFACFLSLFLLQAQCAVLSILNRSLYVDGVRFFGKGVAYGNTPLGQWPDSKKVCTNNWGNSCGWDWQLQTSVYNRDLALLQELGANTVRLYSWKEGTSFDHTPFLDACYARGIYVLASIKWVWKGDVPDVATMKASLDKVVGVHYSHPAILGWLLGNEINLNKPYSATTWAAVKELKDYAHSLERGIWHPVSVTLADGSNMWTIIANHSDSVDVWSVQLYRGQSFGTFFSQYSALQTTANKPVFMTEYGVDGYIPGVSLAYAESEQATYNAKLWDEIVANKNIVASSYVFQWIDGLYKCGTGNIGLYDACSGTRSVFPGGTKEEEYFGILAPTNTVRVDDDSKCDTLRKKAAFEILKTKWASS